MTITRASAEALRVSQRLKTLSCAKVARFWRCLSRASDAARFWCALALALQCESLCRFLGLLHQHNRISANFLCYLYEFGCI